MDKNDINNLTDDLVNGNTEINDGLFDTVGEYVDHSYYNTMSMKKSFASVRPQVGGKITGSGMTRSGPR